MSFLTEVIEKFRNKIAGFDRDVKDILKLEEEEKEVINALCFKTRFTDFTHQSRTL